MVTPPLDDPDSLSRYSWWPSSQLFVIWTALSAEGLGASLQHYNPLIDSAVKKEWGLPEKWRLLAQMPFGKPTDELAEKESMPMDERLRIFR